MPPALAESLAGYESLRHEGGESGGTVHRFTATGETDLFLKHGAGPVATDIADEAHRLLWLEGQFPVPRLRHFSMAGGEAWLLTEALPGLSGDALLEEAGAEAMPMIVAEAARLLRALHALPVVSCAFEAGAELRMAAARRNVVAGLVDADDFDAEHEGWSAERLWTKLESLRPPAGEPVVTHGDYSLGNILFADGQATGLIDVGRLGRADPYQDIAIFWNNLGEFGAEWQDAFLRAYGVVALDGQRLDFHRCLDEFF